MGDLFKQIYYGKILIPVAEREQDEFYYKLEKLKKYDPKTEENIGKKESFLNNTQKIYDGREMVINAFKNKIIPLPDDSYSQYFEEADTDWIEKSEEFDKSKNTLEYDVKEGFNVNFNKKGGETKNISITKMEKFVTDIESGRINNKKSATDRYLKDIYPDKEFLDNKNIVKEAKVKKGKDKGKNVIKNFFHDFEYALFGVFKPRVDNEDLEREKLDIATGGEDIKDMPPLEDEKTIGGE